MYSSLYHVRGVYSHVYVYHIVGGVHINNINSSNKEKAGNMIIPKKKRRHTKDEKAQLRVLELHKYYQELIKGLK